MSKFVLTNTIFIMELEVRQKGEKNRKLGEMKVRSSVGARKISSISAGPSQIYVTSVGEN